MDATTLFAVCGRPVLHSKSPLLFRAAYGKKEQYTYSRIAAGNAGEALSLFDALGMEGMNVTAPFKERMYDLLDEVDFDAERLRAVNVVVRKGKSLEGFNTDYIGMVAALREYGIDVSGAHCLVLGAGGAGRAAAYGLAKYGARVTIANRTVEKARAIAGKVGCAAAGLEKIPELLENADVLLSALAAHAEVVEARWLRSKTVVFDANYAFSPLSTMAAKNGNVVIPGAEWLLQQALPAFERFTGERPDREVMRSALARSSAAAKQIALIGFMGCGKSTIGARLAAKLRLPFADTDELIERQEGRSIPDIFATKGEPYFREREKKVLREALTGATKVIACGGGAVLERTNREILSEHATTIWLHLGVQRCLNRIVEGTRPLLAGGAAHESAQRIYSERKGLYARCADLIVDADADIPAITRKLYEEISETFNHLG